MAQWLICCTVSPCPYMSLAFLCLFMAWRYIFMAYACFLMQSGLFLNRDTRDKRECSRVSCFCWEGRCFTFVTGRAPCGCVGTLCRGEGGETDIWDGRCDGKSLSDDNQTSAAGGEILFYLTSNQTAILYCFKERLLKWFEIKLTWHSKQTPTLRRWWGEDLTRPTVWSSLCPLRQENFTPASEEWLTVQTSVTDRA